MTGTRAGAEAAAREAGHPPPHPNLSFSTGGRPLPGPTSIFQAVQVARQQQQGADAQAAGADPLQVRICALQQSCRRLTSGGCPAQMASAHGPCAALPTDNRLLHWLICW
jgi:hypothetical protein